MTKPIINLKAVELHPSPSAFRPSGETAKKYEAKMGSISRILGARLLGYNITELPPGKSAYPFHNHRINEEMFLILEGTGEIRIGNESYPLEKHDIIACPPGGRESAHQIINTSRETSLRFLAVSTRHSPEIAEYPDSNKFGVLAAFPDEEDANQRTFFYVSRKQNSLDYWEGE